MWLSVALSVWSNCFCKTSFADFARMCKHKTTLSTKVQTTQYVETYALITTLSKSYLESVVYQLASWDISKNTI